MPPSHSKRVTEALEREAQDMCRPCKLLDAAEMSHGVVSIVYAPEPYEGGGSEIRTATYVDGAPRYSTIVSTNWDRPSVEFTEKP